MYAELYLVLARYIDLLTCDKDHECGDLYNIYVMYIFFRNCSVDIFKDHKRASRFGFRSPLHKTLNEIRLKKSKCVIKIFFFSLGFSLKYHRFLLLHNTNTPTYAVEKYLSLLRGSSFQHWTLLIMHSHLELRELGSL